MPTLSYITVYMKAHLSKMLLNFSFFYDSGNILLLYTSGSLVSLAFSTAIKFINAVAALKSGNAAPPLSLVMRFRHSSLVITEEICYKICCISAKGT